MLKYFVLILLVNVESFSPQNTLSNLESDINNHADQEAEDETKKNDLIPLALFENFIESSLEVRSIENYVPKSSRMSYKGEFKIWPTKFNQFLDQLPLNMLKYVNIILYTKGNEHGEILNPWTMENLKNSMWNSSSNTKVLIHGYLQNGTSYNMPIQLKNAYLQMNSSDNILIFDWGPLANLEYFESAMYTQKAGLQLAESLISLKNKGFIKYFDNVHLVGFCLGAHIAGVSGKHIRKRVGKTLGRITGLDPAGPGFHEARNELRLDPLDAELVDVIHTNSGRGFRFGILGISDENGQPIGKSVFYPNGGKSQPVCGNIIKPINNQIFISACHHRKAPDIYTRSIKGEIFRACRCESWSLFDSEKCSCKHPLYMGEYLQRTVGKFYLHVFEYTLFEMFERDGF